MTGTSFTRRVLAGATGVVIGLAGALALSTSAQAVASPDVPDEVEIFNTCDGTYVTFESEDVAAVWVDGEVFWPDADGPGEPGLRLLFVADYEEIVVDFTDDIPSVTHTFTEPDFCGELPEPTLTPATCEAAASITIPVATVLEEELHSVFTLNGDDVEPESTHTVQPGTHTVQFLLRAELVDVTLQIKTWTFQVDAPDCPGDEKLADTGSPLVWIAGTAVALLVIGGGLFFLARRRQADFTA
jgi:hypothetical protein